jgi:hypothetical protein
MWIIQSQKKQEKNILNLIAIKPENINHRSNSKRANSSSSKLSNNICSFDAKSRFLMNDRAL